MMAFRTLFGITFSAAVLFLAGCDWPPSLCDCEPSPSGTTFRQPDAGFSGATYGCGDFEVARQSPDSLRILQVYSTTHPTHVRDTTYLDMLNEMSPIRVRVLRFAAPQHLYSIICDDVAGDDEPVAVDSLVSGVIEVAASGLPRPTMFHHFTMSVLLRDVVLKSGLRIDSVRFDSVAVGWMPG